MMIAINVSTLYNWLLFTKLQHNVQLILDIKLLMYDHVDNNFLCVPQALNYMSSEG